MLETRSTRTVKLCLERGGLHGLQPRRTPLYKKNNLAVRPNFAKSHLEMEEKFWDRVLCSDETKIKLYGNNQIWTNVVKISVRFSPKNGDSKMVEIQG